MNPDIRAYFVGCIFLAFVGIYAYYSLRNAKAVKGSRKYTAIGAALFVLAGILDGIAMFITLSMELRLISFFVWMIAIFILVYAALLIVRAVRRVYTGSLLGMARNHPGSIHNLVGISVLVFIVTPLYIQDLLHTSMGRTSWLFVANTAVAAFCFANLAIASRSVLLSDAKPGTGRTGKLPARPDILAVKAYGDLINAFLIASKPISRGFETALEEYFEHNPILFEDCKLSPDGTIDADVIAGKVDRIHRENRIQDICTMFSALSRKLFNLYGAVTSPRHAEEVLTRNYVAIQEVYGESSVLFDVLRSLPEDVMQKERITLLSRKELEARVRERTRELEASLAEKEVLLKEIHHRVKNNLQVISSLLSLQAGYIEDKTALRMFEESQNRVRSMALIHEKLYQSRDLVRIDFAEYIQDLASHLFRTYGTGDVRLDIDVEDVSLGIDTAIPCGLIVNELISNSLKYAFPATGFSSGNGPERRNAEDEIHVVLRSDDRNSLILIVSDNGVGFPEDLDFRETESLGLQLVKALTEQLDGSIDLDRTGGTTFRISLKIPGHV